MKQHHHAPASGGNTALKHNGTRGFRSPSREAIAPPRKPDPHPPLKRHSVTIPNFRTIAGVSPIAVVSIDDYTRGGIALRVIDHDGPLMTATVWVPGIPAGHVAIKDYPEHEGCLEQLIRHRVVEPTGDTLDGFPICRLGSAFHD
ncbi:conserved hypothetical protein [Haloferula helveola]|uniref:PilZ domain-containing protein n=1 Tax=Haloferula helveola TaxID=490095 RepID=A0ABM7RI63_9BACT|nr:conserved hypothetical protein [Haloferula helveola]